MPEHTPYEQDELFNPETHHESSDVPIRPLWWAVIIFIIFAAVTHLVLGFMYKAMKEAEQKRMPPAQTRVALPANANVPQNQPLLQPFPQKGVAPQASTPVTDLDEMRRREHERLTTYGWVDKQHGVVHIPIEVAKEKLWRADVSSAPPSASPQGGRDVRPPEAKP
ncbi:MAG TPA: hypothetical protein VNA69_00660 [Thermoanaerobaculia bacterium]|nr:hypothetical protein [Thermoanaerobaculia bacterium]